MAVRSSVLRVLEANCGVFIGIYEKSKERTSSRLSQSEEITFAPALDVNTTRSQKARLVRFEATPEHPGSRETHQTRCARNEAHASQACIWGSGTATTCIPAAFPAMTPVGLSSKTKHSLGATPMRLAASKNGSGAGFPCT